MNNQATPVCSNCLRLQAEIDLLRAQLQDLQRQVAALRKDSSNSSKPPSSDIVKAPKPAPPAGQARRKRGGQPGHPKHLRNLLPPELLSSPPIEYRLTLCPDCQGNLHPANLEPHRIQQIDVPKTPPQVVEHRRHAGWCPQCRTIHYAPLPREVQVAGLVGPRLTTLIAYLKGACHASFSTIRKFVRDVLGVTISRGQLVRVIDKVSAALETPYQELQEHLPGQAYLNVDETGHKQAGQRMWTWCFRASLYTLFKIDASRSSEVLLEVLGQEFDGVLGCDYFGAYRRFRREFDVSLQFCLAHLIREVKYLQTATDWRDRCYGLSLGEALRKLFGVIHRKEELSAEMFAEQMEQARQRVLSHGKAEPLVGPEGRSIAQRLVKYGESYFRFVTTPGVEPTNNLAEQAIRFVVLDRVVTQGTRSESGNRWCERIWTALATCGQQGKNVLDYLHDCVVASFSGQASPSLMPRES